MRLTETEDNVLHSEHCREQTIKFLVPSIASSHGRATRLHNVTRSTTNDRQIFVKIVAFVRKVFHSSVG